MGKYQNFPPNLISAQLYPEMPQFYRRFLARDRLGVLTNTDIKEESLLEDHAGVLITPRFRGVQIFR